MDPYSVLGVERTADAETIRKAYKKLARRYHPDVNKEPKSEERFKEINAAYDTVGDPEKRKLFDEFGEASTRAGFDADEARRWRASAAGRGPVGFGTDGIDMEDLLGSLFGSGYGRSAGGFAGARRGADQQAELEIDFLTSILGGDREIRLRRPDGAVENLTVRIPAGAKDGGRLKLRGQGLPPRGGGPAGDLIVTLRIQEHPVLRRVGDDLEMEVPITVEEALVGASIAVPTPTGEVKVNIPAGVGPNTRLRLRGKGVQKSPAGDLFLLLRPVVPASDDPAIRAAAQKISALNSPQVRAGLKI